MLSSQVTLQFRFFFNLFQNLFNLLACTHLCVYDFIKYRPSSEHLLFFKLILFFIINSLFKTSNVYVTSYSLIYTNIQNVSFEDRKSKKTIVQLKFKD